MTFDSNIPGAFGSNTGRESASMPPDPDIYSPPQDYVKPKKKKKHRNIAVHSLSAERWVDIICLSLIAVFLIVVACTWSSFSLALFRHIIFPVIAVGSKIVAGVALIGTAIAVIWAKIRRRRYRW